MEKDEVLKYVDQNYVLSLTRQLIRIPSESRTERERSKDRTPLVNLITGQFKALGLEPKLVTLVEGRPNIVVEIKGDREGPTLLMNSHADTVEVTDADMEVWPFDPFAADIKEGKLYGAGASNAKSGVASAIGAVKAIVESGIKFGGKIIIILVTATESGSPGGIVSMKQQNILPKADGAILADGSDLKIIRSFKGMEKFEFVVQGKSVHVSTPELGINAIEKMIEVIQALKQTRFTETDDPDLGKVTFTPTSFEAINILKLSIPGKSRVFADMRLIPGITTKQAAKKVQEVLDDLMRKDKELNVTMSVIPIAIREAGATPLEDPIVQATAKAMEKVVGQAEYAPGVMATGAMWFLEAGIPAIFFGPGNVLMAPMANEYVDVARLGEATKIYALAALNFLGVPD